MKGYIKFMERFWFVASIAILIGVTIMGFREGFDRWVYFYVFAVLAFLVFLVRRWMRRRMEKHMEWLAQQAANEQQAQGNAPEEK
jgi:hypothetical protein